MIWQLFRGLESLSINTWWYSRPRQLELKERAGFTQPTTKESQIGEETPKKRRYNERGLGTLRKWDAGLGYRMSDSH